MPGFLGIFDVFSKRPGAANVLSHEIPQITRNRVLMWCREVYAGMHAGSGLISRGDYTAEFWAEIYRRLKFRTGRLQLTSSDDGADPRNAIGYLLTCSGGEFLDFLEDIFSAECFQRVSLGTRDIVDELNGLLRQDALPYHLTHFVIENEPRIIDGYQAGTYIHIRAYPKVIMRESEIMHQGAIAPALELLAQRHFRGPNAEFLAALEDYRKGDIGDCLTKCASAFESVLKVICDRKGWKYGQTDTASTLIKTVLSNTTLGGYFEQLLIIIATLRNKLSTAHGGGTAPRTPPRHIGQYALNATASAILLLVEETGA